MPITHPSQSPSFMEVLVSLFKQLEEMSNVEIKAKYVNNLFFIKPIFI
jgi:hypothetical protein